MLNRLVTNQMSFLRQSKNCMIQLLKNRNLLILKASTLLFYYINIDLSCAEMLVVEAFHIFFRYQVIFLFQKKFSHNFLVREQNMEESGKKLHHFLDKNMCLEINQYMSHRSAHFLLYFFSP